MEACTEFPDPNNSLHTFITSLFMTLIAIPTKVMLEKLFALSNDSGVPDLWLTKAKGFAPPLFPALLFGVPPVKWYFETGPGHVR